MSDRPESNQPESNQRDNQNLDVSELRVVGRVKDAHGLKGEIWVVLFAGEADWLESMDEDAAFILVPSEKADSTWAGGLKRYELKGSRAHKNGVILKSPEIKDRTAAELLKGRFLAVPEYYLESEAGDVPYLDEVDGFEILEDDGRKLGTIIDFGTNGLQDLLVVELVTGARPGVKAKDRADIPFVEAYILDVDYETKSIRVKLPPGLIEVQLGLDSTEDEEQTEPGVDFDDVEADDESGK